jgi:hypothetical protein
MKKLVCRPIKLPTLTEKSSRQLSGNENSEHHADAQRNLSLTHDGDDSCSDYEGSPKKSVSPMMAAIIAADFPRMKRLQEMLEKSFCIIFIDVHLIMFSDWSRWDITSTRSTGNLK